MNSSVQTPSQTAFNPEQAAKTCTASRRGPEKESIMHESDIPQIIPPCRKISRRSSSFSGGKSELKYGWKAKITKRAESHFVFIKLAFSTRAA